MPQPIEKVTLAEAALAPEAIATAMMPEEASPVGELPMIGKGMLEDAPD